MSLGALGLGYVAVGAVVAAVCAALRGRPAAGDVALLLALWPLWAPLVLARGRDGSDADGDGDPGARDLLAALARAQASPMASILPDAGGARALAGRVREARRRLAELDAVLARPELDLAAVERRVVELAERGSHSAAATTRLRVRTIGRLRGLRERYRAELDEVHELIAQLVAQAELVRLQPAIAPDSELIRELVAQIEGLDDLESEYEGAAARSLTLR
jgi:hypothetical protein